MLTQKKLDLTTFTDGHAIILRKTDSCFEYVPALKTTLHRAMCLMPIPFPRKRGTVSTLVAIKEIFLSQLQVVEKSMNSASQMVDSSMRILPEVPTEIVTSLTKSVNLEVEITSKINQLNTEVETVIAKLKTLKNPEELSEITVRHSIILNSLQSLEGEIMEPVFRPLAFF